LSEKKRIFDVIAETERLIIRPLKSDDYQNWFNEFNNRFPSQYKHDKGRMDMSVCTEEWFHNLVNKHQELALSDVAHVFGIFRKEDGIHLGMVDFSTLARDVFQWARIGYSIHNQFWKNGYCKEAVKEAVNIAFKELEFHRIEAHINLDNTPSINTAMSIGMEFECIRKGFIYENEEWTDHLVYCINSK
jgi:[ribosomal protein S5]-alanine N-acetyltransferase